MPMGGQKRGEGAPFIRGKKWRSARDRSSPANTRARHGARPSAYPFGARPGASGFAHPSRILRRRPSNRRLDSHPSPPRQTFEKGQGVRHRVETDSVLMVETSRGGIWGNPFICPTHAAPGNVDGVEDPVLEIILRYVTVIDFRWDKDTSRLFQPKFLHHKRPIVVKYHKIQRSKQRAEGLLGIRLDKTNFIDLFKLECQFCHP